MPRSIKNIAINRNTKKFFCDSKVTEENNFTGINSYILFIRE